MGKLNLDSVQLLDVVIAKNEICPNGAIILKWDSNIGFGEYTLELNNSFDYDESSYDDYELKIIGDSEYMDKEEKHFCVHCYQD